MSRTTQRGQDSANGGNHFMCVITRYKAHWFIVVMACLSACTPRITSPSITITPTSNLSTKGVTKPATTAMATPLPTDTIIPPSTASITSENTATPTTPFVTNTSQPATDILINQCPEVIDMHVQPLWSSGSILFGTGLLVNHYADVDAFKPQEPGIWAISAHKAEPQLAYAVSNSSISSAFLSDDGNTLVYTDIDASYIMGDQSQPETVFYDLRSQTEIWFTDGPGIVWNYEWLADGRAKFLANEERLWEVGVRREYLVLDPETRQSETLLEELSLPGYQFNDEPRPHGYASVSPSGEFALYTATADSGVDIRLLNLMTGEILWQQHSQALPGPYQPEWSKDSSHVLFYIHDLIGGESYVKILSLASNGELDELPQQPYPQLSPNTFDHFLTASPDRRYIIYRAGLQERKGIVIDVATSQVREICETNATFIDGQWLPNNLFVYRVLIQVDGQLTQAMRILDISSWTSQMIFEPNPGYGINIFGWTPVEFPN